MNHIGPQKSKETQKVMQGVVHFLIYATSNPNANIMFIGNIQRCIKNICKILFST